LIKVGLPRALLYYQFFPLCKAFFEELGAEVIISPPTTKAVLADGSARVVAETCLPTKVFCGHVLALKDKVDFYFIPSVRSLEPRVYNCSKFLGLPDLIRGTIKDIPPIVDVDIDVNIKKRKIYTTIYEVGRKISRNPAKVYKAAKRALEVHRSYIDLLATGLTIPQGLRLFAAKGSEELRSERPASDKPDGDYLVKVALIGHPYNIYDTYVNHNILRKLEQMKVKLVTSEMVKEEDLRAGIGRLIGKPYWTFEAEVVGAAGYYLEGEVDGILAVVSFGCGPDSVMVDVVERACRKRGMPFMMLTIDEHTGEAGLVTRLEAFIDMLTRRKQGAALVRG